MENIDIGSLETREDAGQGEEGLVKLWLDAIDLSSKEEENWRKAATDVVQIYRDDKYTGDVRRKEQFNILYSNIETIVPALYNSTPVPDIRRRFGEVDEAGKLVSQALERAISYEIDTYNFDSVMTSAVQDSELVGRGVTRVRYEPTFSKEPLLSDAQEPVLDKQGQPVLPVVYEEAVCEHVPWANFRHGPARRWELVPWIAFEHCMTREELVKLNPQIGATLTLDIMIEGVEDKGSGLPSPDVFKRARVWEVWDKEKREVLFIAPCYKEAPLKREQDPLNLMGFFPIPMPLYAIKTSDSLVPIEPYRYYRDQAEELDRITRRITSLINVLKWRGFRASDIDEMGRLTSAEDGDLLPITNPMAFAGKNGLESAIWLMPLEKAVQVIQSLYQQREQIIQIIYQITGISDILRGSTNPNETLGAQQLKAQWGSQRLQKSQNEVARYVRDLFRLKAEIIAEKFSPETIVMMTGVQLTPDAIKLMQSDLLRQYRVDIETDSTIKADLGRAQENISNFLTGFSNFLSAVGPAVQSGEMPKDVATDLLASFARNFKLGRQAEDALERMGQGTQQNQQQQMQAQQAQANQQAQQEQAAQQAEAIKRQADQENMSMELEFKRQEHAMKMQELQLKHQITMAELQARAATLSLNQIPLQAA